MPRLAANLSMLFTEVPFIDRFGAAAEAGFGAVEFMFPYDWPAETVAQAARARDLRIVLFNCPAGDWSAGERGIAALPDRIAECRDGVARALRYARALGCDKLHLMAGLVPPDADRAEMFETLVENVRFAADLVADDGIQILLEPINTRVDMPGYFYATSDAAIAVMDRVDRPNVRLQYDIYHMQIMEGDLIRHIEALFDRIGHVQLADNPGRGEPGTGEIHFAALFERLDQLGYAGHVGCEYRPLTTTRAGLGWAAAYLG
ncbi:hydroxypyruvate isomerase [soil metagenome]